MSKSWPSWNTCLLDVATSLAFFYGYLSSQLWREINIAKFNFVKNHFMRLIARQGSRSILVAVPEVHWVTRILSIFEYSPNSRRNHLTQHHLRRNRNILQALHFLHFLEFHNDDQSHYLHLQRKNIEETYLQLYKNNIIFRFETSISSHKQNLAILLHLTTISTIICTNFYTYVLL